MTPRIKISERYSALCVYRWYRRIYGWRTAYWIALAKHGYPEWRDVSKSIASIRGAREAFRHP